MLAAEEHSHRSQEKRRWISFSRMRPSSLRRFVPPDSPATRDSDIHKIQTPVLLLEGEDDTVFAGQAAHVAAELPAPHEHVVMRSADGAGAHCHEGAMYLLHQTIFNYLAKTLG
jgi:pimeloyl-ACP methyl ester carboxylesterase